MFYYKEKSEKQNEFLYDILNNLKNGVFLYNVEKRKTKYFNNYLKKYKEFQKALPDIAENTNTKTNENEGFLNRDYKYIMKEVNIFRYFVSVNKDLPPNLIEAFSNMSYEETIDIINAQYCNSDDDIFFKENLFLGYLELTLEDNSPSMFEFYIKGVNGFQGLYFQFMLNDVTKTKILQEKLLKEKTLLLGKVSHEFKNPCIVITESIEELKETNTVLKDRELSEKLKFLSNLSEYMIMLIKDFEVMASIENQLNVDLFPVEFSTQAFLKDIDEIVNTLIKKKNAKELYFKLNIDNSIDTLITDSLRLKQILINLLSNSVKFSEKGTIELKLERYYLPENQDFALEGEIGKKNNNENELIEFSNNDNIETLKQYIKFSIIDSGKGISSDFIQSFNNNLAIKKENTIENSVGSGYGLGIVKNLCQIIGTSIKAETNSPNGSVFYFYIRQEKPKDSTKLIAQKSIYNIDDDEDIFGKISKSIDNDNRSQISLPRINLNNSKQDIELNVMDKHQNRSKIEVCIVFYVLNMNIILILYYLFLRMMQIIN